MWFPGHGIYSHLSSGLWPMGGEWTWSMQLPGHRKDKDTCLGFPFFPLSFAEKHWNSSSSLRPRAGSPRQRMANLNGDRAGTSPSLPPSWSTFTQNLSAMMASFGLFCSLLHPQPRAHSRNSKVFAFRALVSRTLLDSCLSISVPSSRLGFAGCFSLTIK